MTITSSPAAFPLLSTHNAYLEHVPEQGAHLERIPLTVLPLTIGRGETNDQRVYVPAVSKNHAVFVAHASGCAIRDLGSTNGTFVNGERVRERLLVDGDIIHLGPVEFCYRAPVHAVALHPRELDDTGFLASLAPLRATGADRPLVLEIAESAVTSVSAMARTRDAFRDLGFEFAYDDFGAGQARLLELTDIPPHFLKLDLQVIEGIEVQRPRQDVVRALLNVVGSLGVQVIAEGIETESVAGTCARLGCHLGQGYLFGKPEPADATGAIPSSFPRYSSDSSAY